MSMNPNQGQNSDSTNQYGGYTGYSGTPPSQSQAYNPDDPYNSQWYGQQGGTTGYQGTQQQQQQQATGSQQQQQQSYQPPASAQQRTRGSSASSSATDASGTSTFGLNARIAALLSYALTWLGGLFFLITERRNQFVRFAAAQSLTIFGPLTVVYILLQLIAHIPILGTFLLAPIIGCLTPLILLVGGVLWVFLAVQAYRGVTVRLPVISQYADRLLARFSRRTS